MSEGAAAPQLACMIPKPGSFGVVVSAPALTGEATSRPHAETPINAAIADFLILVSPLVLRIILLRPSSERSGHNGHVESIYTSRHSTTRQRDNHCLKTCTSAVQSTRTPRIKSVTCYVGGQHVVINKIHGGSPIQPTHRDQVATEWIYRAWLSSVTPSSRAWRRRLPHPLAQGRSRGTSTTSSAGSSRRPTRQSTDTRTGRVHL